MLLALFGGVLIGLSASLAHAGARQVVGVSGLVGGLFTWPPQWLRFGTWFVLGLVLGGVAMTRWSSPTALAPRSLGWLLVSGLMVGFGTRLGSGCTSGHGVCGTSRLSPRSFVATGVFMATAAVVVFFTRHVLAAWGAR
jgi:uncharacterized membrane protein YedE/YeeE